MGRKEKGLKSPIEIIQMDATILDIELIDNGGPIKRPKLFTVANVHNRQAGTGLTVGKAIESLRQDYEKEP